MIVKAETVIAWHRKGFRLFWTWRIRCRKPGRPSVPREVRDLIRMLSRNNPRWGAPRIHGELLKLGIEITEPTVAKYMVRHRKPPSQTWRTFLANHVQTIVSVDFFTVPTIRFGILYVFLVLAHERRRIVHFAVTAHPTAEGSLVRFAVSVWITSSSSGSALFVVLSRRMLPITTAGALICRSAKTPRNTGECSLPQKVRWSKFVKLVAYTITTNAEPPNYN